MRENRSPEIEQMKLALSGSLDEVTKVGRDLSDEDLSELFSREGFKANNRTFETLSRIYRALEQVHREQEADKPKQLNN